MAKNPTTVHVFSSILLENYHKIPESAFCLSEDAHQIN